MSQAKPVPIAVRSDGKFNLSPCPMFRRTGTGLHWKRQSKIHALSRERRDR